MTRRGNDGWANLQPAWLSTAHLRGHSDVDNSDGGFKVRVQATVTDGDPVNSDVVALQRSMCSPASCRQCATSIRPGSASLSSGTAIGPRLRRARIVGGFSRQRASTSWVGLSTKAFEWDGICE